MMWNIVYQVKLKILSSNTTNNKPNPKTFIMVMVRTSAWGLPNVLYIIDVGVVGQKGWKTLIWNYVTEVAHSGVDLL